MIDNFKSKRLIYSEICATDADNIVRWRSNPTIYQFFRNPEPLLMEKHIEWYENRYKCDVTRFEYVITHKESNTPIGIIGVSNLQEHALQIGYLIGKTSFQNQGFASEAITALLAKYKEIGINRFLAEIHKNNIASIKTIEKCGFVFDREIDSNFLLYKKSLNESL